MAAENVIDLSSGDEATESRALTHLKKNLAHLLISAQAESGPEIDFGERGVLVFKPKVPVTAMEALIGEENRVKALQSYIRLSLQEESREAFDALLDDLDLAGLNAIVEAVTEATTPFPSQ